MSDYRTYAISFIIFVIKFTDAAKILCWYPVPFDSHLSVYQVFTEALANAGHEVVVLKPSTKQPWRNVTEINHIESYNMWDQTFSRHVNTNNIMSISTLAFWDGVQKTLMPIMDKQLGLDEMQKLIKYKKDYFDMLITESAIMTPLILKAWFDKPVVLISSLFNTVDTYTDAGAPVDPLIFPEYKQPYNLWNSYTWDKLYVLYIDFKIRQINWKYETESNRLITKHFGDNLPSLRELRRNVDLSIMNVHHVWDNNRPVPPSVIYLGGLHLKTPKPVKGDLKQYMDNSTHGVIYMSFGSKFRCSDLPPHIISTMVDVFALLPYDVLWKWDDQPMANKPDNVRLEEWLPQNDILHHPKMKAFISHGGQQSTDEAITARVPLIGLPLIADQFSNSFKYTQFKIGHYIDWNQLDFDTFRNAIIDIAEEQSYRRNIENLASLMETQRSGALQRTIKLVEYIAEHGSQNMKPPSVDIPFHQYYVLDVVVLLLVIVALVTAIIVVALKYVFKHVIIPTHHYINRHKLKVH